MAKYSDCIAIKGEFVPVFSKDADVDGRWKQFFPHETFIKILKDLTRSLRREKATDNLSHWIHGAYGTGKTYASIVINHLLEDDIDDVVDYLKQNNISQHDIDKFKEARQDKGILVVHRSSSSEITNSQLLFNAIQSSIRQSLSEKGFEYRGGKTAYDSILSELKNPESPVHFGNIMKSCPQHFSAYMDLESVIDSLEKNGPDGSNSLLGCILDAMVESHFYPVRSAEDIKKWIEDIIEKNGIDSLVFIWDEFGDYFRNDPSSTSLQEVAHLSASCPFYFMLITHKDIGQFIADADRRKILEARFHNNHIQLPNATAIELVSRVVSAVEGREEELQNIRISLGDRVEKSSSKISSNLANSSLQGPLKQLLPLHPFTSYILTVFSQSISSNQRTMFKFMESKSEDNNFNWFIDNASVGQLMTIDYLWDYFFKEDNPDIDESTRQKISYYSIHKDNCDDDTRAVFKALVLLSALESKTNSASPLLRPTLGNLTLAFDGTDLFTKVRDSCKDLSCKKVINIMPQQGGDELYITSSGANFDAHELEDQKLVLRDQWRLEKILGHPFSSVQGLLDYKGAMHLRFSFHHITKDSFHTETAKLKTAPANRIPVCFLYYLTEEDRIKCQELVKRELSNLTNCMLVEMALPLTEKSYDEFVTQLANSHFYEKSGDHNNAKYCKGEAFKIIEQWRLLIYQKTLTAYGPASTNPMDFADVSAFKKHLEATNLKHYRYAIEHIHNNDNLFKNYSFSANTAKMGMDKAQPTGSLPGLRDKLKSQAVWDDKTYWEKSHLTDLPISQAKNFVEAYIEESFNKSSLFSVYELWNQLKRPPYGFIRSVASAFIVGFLLKDYNSGEYFLQDANGMTQTLNVDTLAMIIDQCIKESDKASDYNICKMKPGHREFCDDMVAVFHLAKESYTLSSVKTAIRESLTKTKLPIWAATHFVNSMGDDIDEDVPSMIGLLTKFVAPEDNANEQEIADQMISAGYKQHIPFLIKCFEIDNLKAGMRTYMHECVPELDELCKSIGLGADELIQRLDSKINAASSWLWEQDTFKEQIDTIHSELLLVKAINGIVPNKSNSIEQARAEMRKLLRSTKIAYGLLLTHSEMLGDFIKRANDFTDLSYNTDSDSRTALVQLITEKSDEIENYFRLIKKLFIKIVSDTLGDQANEEVCREMYEKLDLDAYDDSNAEYEEKVSDLYKENLVAMKLDNLRKQWSECTSTDSPADWSNQNRIPIACLFEGDISQSAIPIFGILNNGAVKKLNEETLDAALAFIESDESLNILNDDNGRNQAFLAYFAGEYASLIEDKVEEYKDYLSKEIGVDVGSWLSNKTLYTNRTKQFVYGIYQQALLDKVLRSRP